MGEDWNSPFPAPAGSSSTYQSPVHGRKFKDPYEVFKNVLQDEFGETYKPGKEPVHLGATPTAKANGTKANVKGNKHAPAKKTGSAKKFSTNSNNSKSGKDEDDNRAVNMSMRTRKKLHDDGRVETITTTIIDRPNGEQERHVESSFDKQTKSKSLNTAQPQSSSKTGRKKDSKGTKFGWVRRN